MVAAAKPTPRPPSVKDVATRAQVSVGTVSNVINGRGSVRSEIRERVEAAIKDLGYVPNPTAQALRRGVSPLVGVAVLDLTNPFFMEAAAGMERRLAADGCVMALSATQSDPELESRLLRTLAGQAVRGILLTPASTDLSTAEEIVKRGIPVVLFDFPGQGMEIPSVSVDDRAGARQAIQHLLDLGHRQIAFLNGPAHVRQARERRAGVDEAIAARGEGSDAVSVTIREVESFTAQAGRAAMRAMLDTAGIAVTPFAERGDIGAPPPPVLPEGFPTAIFCANDLIAFGAMTVLRDAGIRVPHDVSLVGFDDIAMARQMSVPLTTIRQPMEEIGRAAADLLLSPPGSDSDNVGDSDSDGVQHRRFVPELVVRSSTTAPSR